MFAAAPGDGKERGLNRLAHERLVRRVVGGHWALVPKLSRLALDDRIEAYNLPLGCVSQLYRDIAARPARDAVEGRPCAPSSIRASDGGKLNARTTEDLVRARSRCDGKAWLLYKTFPIHVALVRGTTADPAGNITMEREALTARRPRLPRWRRRTRAGFVIAQVERIAAGGLAAPPREVRSPASWSTASSSRRRRTTCRPTRTAYNRAFSGQLRVPLDRVEPLPSTSARSSPAAAPSSCRWAASSTSASACPRASPRWRPRSGC